MSDDTPILPGLSPVCGLDIHARFDDGAMTSKGGALLLREAGRGLDLAKVLAGCIRDARDPAKGIHSYASMIDARVAQMKTRIRVSFPTAKNPFCRSSVNSKTRLRGPTTEVGPIETAASTTEAVLYRRDSITVCQY